MDDRFGVSVRTIPMPFGFQFGSQRFVIVDLAIEGYPNAAILVSHRIAAGGREVYDRETPIAQANATICVDVHTCVVRPAMGHRVAHAYYEAIIDVGPACAVFVDSTNSAHNKT